MISSAVANPCGLIAKYHFTDRFGLEDSLGNLISIDETNIAHKVDRESKFKRAEPTS